MAVDENVMCAASAPARSRAQPIRKPAVCLALALLLSFVASMAAQAQNSWGLARVGFVTATQVRPEVNRESYKDLITLSKPVRYTIGGTAPWVLTTSCG